MKKKAGISNYDKMKNDMASVFLQYNQENMIRKFALASDKNYLYMECLNRRYRVSRSTGQVEWSEDDFITAKSADYNEAMTIYDLLCNSVENCHLAHEWVNVKSLPAVLGGNLVRGGDFFQHAAEYFDGKTEALAEACEALGGKKREKGDVAYELPLFPFLPVVVRFWNSDEEFPASLQLLTDKNMLDYMHYETVMFALSHLVSRLKEEIQQKKKEEQI
ncbi:MAG: DUF3786 domain-containing protein [Ruminococcus sp.]|jgi:hypothetical protein